MNKNNKKKLSLKKVTIELVPGTAGDVAGATGGAWCLPGPTLTKSCASCQSCQTCGCPSAACFPCVGGY